MRTTHNPVPHFILLSLSMIAPLAGGCGASSQDASEEDISAAKEAEGERLTDADKVLDFASGEKPDTEVPEPAAFPWGKVYFFAAGDFLRVGNDYYPVGHEFVTPVGIIKLLITIPDKVSDWMRGSNYANFTLPNPTNEPLKVQARLRLENLNWYFSHGKASLRVCKVRASGEEYECANLGSVKDGTRTRTSVDDTPSDGLLPRTLRLRHYTRDYPLVIPAGESLHVQVKHKLECTIDPYTRGREGPNPDCRAVPVPSIQFTKVP